MIHGQVILSTGQSDLPLQTRPKQVAFGRTRPFGFSSTAPPSDPEGSNLSKPTDGRGDDFFLNSLWINC